MADIDYTGLKKKTPNYGGLKKKKDVKPGFFSALQYVRQKVAPAETTPGIVKSQEDIGAVSSLVKEAEARQTAKVGEIVKQLPDTSVPAASSATAGAVPKGITPPPVPTIGPTPDYMSPEVERMGAAGLERRAQGREHGMIETLLDKGMDEGMGKEIARGFARLADLPGLTFESGVESGSREIQKAGDVLAKEGVEGVPEAAVRTLSGVVHPVLGTVMAVTPQGLMFSGTNQLLEDYDPTIASFVNSAMSPLQTIFGGEGLAGALAGLGDVGMQTVVMEKLLEGPTPENQGFVQQMLDAQPLMRRGVTFQDYLRMKKDVPATVEAIAKTPQDERLTPGQSNVLNRYARRKSLVEGMQGQEPDVTTMRDQLVGKGYDEKRLANLTEDQVKRLYRGDESVMPGKTPTPGEGVTGKNLLKPGDTGEVKTTIADTYQALKKANPQATNTSLADMMGAKHTVDTAIQALAEEKGLAKKASEAYDRAKAETDPAKSKQMKQDAMDQMQDNQGLKESVDKFVRDKFKDVEAITSTTNYSRGELSDRLDWLKEGNKPKDFPNLKKAKEETPAAPKPDEWVSAAEPAAAIPGEPIHFLGGMENPRATIEEGQEGGYVARIAGQVVVNKPGQPHFDTVEEARAAAEAALKAKENPPPAPPSPPQLNEEEDKGRTQQIQINNSPVTEIPMSTLDVDPPRFQPRLKLNEDQVNRIINNFDPRNLDPLTVWKDPKDGRYKVLNGHHRYAALTRQGIANAPVRIFEGTEKEAKDYARRANNEQLAQNTLDNASTLRRMREEGVAKGKIEEEAKNIHGRNGLFFMDLSYINPKGKAHQTIESFVDIRSDDADKVTNRARWIGAMRKLNPELTDAHENEMFDYLMSQPKFTSQSMFQDFIDRIVAKREGADPATPLNLTNFVATSPEVQAFDAALLEAQKASNQANQRYTDLLGRMKQQGATDEEIAAKTERAKMERDAAETHLATIKAQREMFIEHQDRAQTNMFDAIDNEKEVLRNNGLTEDQIDAAEKTGDPNAVPRGATEETAKPPTSELTFEQFRDQEAERLGSRHPAVKNEEQLRRRYEKTIAKKKPPTAGEPKVPYGEEETSEVPGTEEIIPDLDKLIKMKLASLNTVEAIDREFIRLNNELSGQNLSRTEKMQLEEVWDAMLDKRNQLQPPVVSEPSGQYGGKQTVQQRQELSDRLRDLVAQKAMLQKQLDFARSKDPGQSAGKEKITRTDFLGRALGEEVVERTYGEKARLLAVELQKLTNEVNRTKRELFRGEKSMLPQEKLFEETPGEEGAPAEEPPPPPKKAAPGQGDLFAKEPNSQFGSSRPDPEQLQMNFETGPSVHTTDANGEPLAYQSTGASGITDQIKAGLYSFARVARTALGEVRHVESVFTRKTDWQFYGSKERIRNSGDIANMMRPLQDSRVEHTLLVHHGKRPIVQYLATGAQSSSMVDPSAVFAGITQFDSKEVTFVHNHPSGVMKPSEEDIALLTALHNAHPSVKINGIIIDLKDGIYADYTKNLFGQDVEASAPTKPPGRVPIETVVFDKNVFFTDATERPLLNRPDLIAKAVSSSLFGTNTRATVVTLDYGLKVTGHYLLNADINDAEAAQREIAELAISSGAPKVVIAVNRSIKDFSPETSKLKRIQSRLSGYGIGLLDVVGVSSSKDAWNETDYSSYTVDGVLREPDPEYDGREVNKSNMFFDAAAGYMSGGTPPAGPPPAPGQTATPAGGSPPSIRQSLWDGIKYLAGYTFPRMTRADRESAEHLARYVASPQAAVPMAKSLAQMVIPRTGVDENVLGAVASEDMLRGNKNRYLAQGNIDAANKVNTLVGAQGSPFQTEAEYRRMRDDPRVRAAVQLHIEHVVPELRKLFIGEQMLDPDVELNNKGETFNTYFPLKAVRDEDELMNPQSRVVRPGTGTTTTGTSYLTPLRQRSGRYKRVTGTAEAYDHNYTNMVAKAISDMLENHNKNKLYESLEANGTGAISAKGNLYPTINGEETVKIPIQRRTIVTKRTDEEGETKTRVAPQSEFLYLPKSLKAEYDAAFTKGRIIKSTIGRSVSGALTGITLTSFSEPIYHLLFNIAPTSFRIGGWRNLIKIASQSVRPADPANLKYIQRYTEIGAARPAGPPQPKYHPLKWTGQFIHHVDEISRVQAVKIFDELATQFPGKVPKTDTNLREFVNQLGNYNARSQGTFVRAMKESGLSPFLTAIRTSTANAAKGGVLNMGVEGIKVRQRLLVAQKFGSAIALIAGANYALNGSVFGRKDKYIPLLSIDTGVDDSKGQPITIPVGRLLGMDQILQYSGARGAIESMRKGETLGQSLEQGARDIAGTAMRPISESPAARLAFSGLTGRALTPELQRIYPVVPPDDSQLLSDITYSTADINPFSSMIAGRVLPEQMRRNQSMAEAMARTFPFIRVTKQPPPQYEKMIHGAKLNEYESYIARELRKLKPYERMKYLNEHTKDVEPQDRARLIKKLQAQAILAR